MALPAVSAFQGTTSKTTIYSALPCPKLFAFASFGIKNRTFSKHFRATFPVKSLKPRLRHSKALGTVRIVAQSDFADSEAAKFKEGLLSMLADDENIGEQRVPMVETCTKIFRQFAMSYKGELQVDPFVEMRFALEGQGIPLPKVGKVTRGAIGWSRYNLYRDWKKWSTSN
ncbi:hypothetical protein SUGI_0575600 [Cryptomeria japonica]|uniref:protein PLASTID REDOX INSENSITIVE 2, chloroplastic n=1 Tax=Cryptomeria japonica TaxID=3369 RepID=UPI0024089D7B|nr:protein PLASTID REDOX INSENSITIVE 2, chloroplastic [Cryptomeria japonica]GLJ29186.1 hypothetical protein SUGI_0575600 [Cryptomeria japonica]